MTVSEEFVVPDGWELTRVGAITTDIQPGFASGRHNSTGDGLPHLRPMNVSTAGKIDRVVTKYVDPELADRPERRLQPGDVLFNNTNSLELVGKTAFFDDDNAPAFSNHMTRLRTDPDVVLPEYLARYLHACWRRGDFTQIANNHVSQASVSRKALSALPILFPSPAQQRQIIELLSRVDQEHEAASVHLAQAKGVLLNFRRTVLAAACSGRLTEDWRTAHPDVSVIQLEKLAGPRKGRKRSSEMPVDFDIPEVPETYATAPISTIATAIEYGTSRKADGDTSDVPVLRMGNIQDGSLDLSDLKYVTRDDEVERLLLQDGDLLFNRTNSPELVGKSAVWRESGEATFASYLIRVQFHEDAAVPEFVNYWISSSWGRAWARQVKTDGVSQSNINGTKLGAMPVSLPPLDEQREIVRRVEALLEGSAEILSKVNTASALVERASQAALSKAFRGELSGPID